MCSRFRRYASIEGNVGDIQVRESIMASEWREKRNEEEDDDVASRFETSYY